MAEPHQEEISFIAVGVMIIVVNFIEVICILRKNNKTTFEKLLLSLALSDLLVGAITTVYKTLDFVLGQRSWLIEEVTAVVLTLSSIFSSQNLLAITIDRFLAIRFPIKHRILVTARRTNVLIIFTWVLSCIVGIGIDLILVVLVPSGGDYIMTASTVAIISIGAIVSIIYVCIIRFLFTRQVAVAARPEDGKVFQKIQAIFRELQKTERTVLLSSVIVTATFIICTFPFAIEYLRYRNAETLTFASKMLIILNSLLNPFVYFFNNFLRKSCTKPQ